MGVELGIAEFKIHSHSDLLPSWMRHEEQMGVSEDLMVDVECNAAAATVDDEDLMVDVECNVAAATVDNEDLMVDVECNGEAATVDELTVDVPLPLQADIAQCELPIAQSCLEQVQPVTQTFLHL